LLLLLLLLSYVVLKVVGMFVGPRDIRYGGVFGSMTEIYVVFL